MSRITDFLRSVFVSPELLFALVPLAIYAYEPMWADMLHKPMSDSVGWGLSAAGLSIGMLAFSYKEAFDLLSLSGGRKVLIEWPDYPKLKVRVLIAFGWCVLGSIACICATWMVAKAFQPLLGITLLISGIFSAATATATIALARFSLRELLGE
ncbi:hypothetical protein B9Z45_09995 [Limnohabitans sp. 2KL-17]|uniref:hypothetical protein n=1 Tax=Limnohabitans sp. 2KL-17 TaxID=1100704 RepID=UPI000D3B78A6|nr:hypothetical protein [Limnohabitans sp. 2KL-17]PUE56371.1 hypothetical protein B9Z45_09995 [Limnohabitans sp. 2KL-17]